MEKLTLSIDGMSCGHCVARVKQTLAATPGVRVDEVTIGAASLAFDPLVTSASTIASAVGKAGYAARPSSVSSAASE